MRLLNTSTYELEEFFGKNVPKYAILSHRWEQEEVTFQDLQSQASDGEVRVRGKAGWAKIVGCCLQALKEGYEWVWVDTCCIDKSSSAELSEAINSMFNWYRDAEVCYAFLSDVPPVTEATSRDSIVRPFNESKWFTRGWTLQELLAPKYLMFYAQDWSEIGTKLSLSDLIAGVTGIKKTWVHEHLRWQDASVAQKMSWASKRETTRTEDRAYSLMGIFGVNMPPLYGEGENAFMRLQNEIIRVQDDESIFAWLDGDNNSGGLLARSPAAFKDCREVFRLDPMQDTAPFSMTNKGIRLEASLIPCRDPTWPSEEVKDTYLVPIECSIPEYQSLAIRLRRLHGNQFVRLVSDSLVPLKGRGIPVVPSDRNRVREVVFVLQSNDGDSPLQGPYNFDISTKALIDAGFKLLRRHVPPRCLWTRAGSDVESLRVSTLSRRGATISLEFTRRISGIDDRVFLVIELYQHSVNADIMILRGHDRKEMTKAFESPGWLSNLHLKERRRLFGNQPNVLADGQHLLVGFWKVPSHGAEADVQSFRVNISLASRAPTAPVADLGDGIPPHFSGFRG